MKQQNQGQNRLSNSVINVITYPDDILVIVNRNLILTVSRGPIKVLWIVKWLQLGRVTNENPKEKPKW